MNSPKEYSKREQRKIIYLMMLVQFVNIFEFMLLVPVSPDFIVELGIISSNIGYISGTYSIMAALTGLVIVSFIDRIEPKKVLITCFAIMMVGTIVAAAAQNELMLIISKIITGMCGGPATALTLTVVTDVVPIERRGRAMGKVLSGFVLSAVLAVPLGLEISRLYGWRYAFLFLLFLEFILILMLVKFLPEVRNSHELKTKVNFKQLFYVMTKRLYITAFSISFVTMISGFLLIPNLPNYMIYNLETPREKLSMLYFIGGIVSFLVMRITGKISDYKSALSVNAFFSGCFIITIFFYIVRYVEAVPIFFYFSIFMICMTSRNVVTQALVSKVPLVQDRASFFCVQNAINNLAMGAGGYISSLILTEGENFKLEHIEYIGLASIIFATLVPWLTHLIEKRILLTKPNNINL